MNLGKIPINKISLREVAYMLPINEVFETIQGEGIFTGVPAIFLRLQGCPIGCSWCDTKHTWNIDVANKIEINDVLAKKAESDKYTELDEAQILALFKTQQYQAKHVVITGGEPCMYDLNLLTSMLHDAGYSTQIETSGTFAVKTSLDTWVTVSPKVNMQGGYSVLTEALDRADEIKHPVAMQKHIDELDALLKQRTSEDECEVCLQPISQQARATELAMQTCIERNWRLSIQMHKYIGIE